MSEKILLFGYSLMALQVIFAWHDGYATQWQLHTRGITNAYSLMEHGGMWADIFIIIPIVAYVTSNYHLAYTSWYSILIFVIACAFIGVVGYGYTKGEKKMPTVILPDSYVHDGKTTPAGWIHLLFAVAALYVLVMFYFTPLDPPASQRDIVGVSSLLTPFFFLNICKFTRRWKFSRLAQVQVSVSCFVLWSVTAIKLLHH